MLLLLRFLLMLFLLLLLLVLLLFLLLLLLSLLVLLCEIMLGSCLLTSPPHDLLQIPEALGALSDLSFSTASAVAISKARLRQMPRGVTKQAVGSTTLHNDEDRPVSTSQNVGNLQETLEEHCHLKDYRPGSNARSTLY